MHRRTVRPLVVAVLSATLGTATLAASPAQAASAVFSDTRGDVRVVTLDDEGNFDDPPPSRASATEDGDVLRTAVSHNARTVGIRVRFADLRRVGAVYQFAVAGDNGKRRFVTVDTSDRSAGETEVTDRDGDEVRCGVRHRIDYTENVISLALARSCVSNPSRIRVAGTAAWFRLNDDDSIDVVYDDAFTEGGEPTENPVFSGAVGR